MALAEAAKVSSLSACLSSTSADKEDVRQVRWCRFRQQAGCHELCRSDRHEAHGQEPGLWCKSKSSLVLSADKQMIGGGQSSGGLGGLMSMVGA